MLTQPSLPYPSSTTFARPRPLCATPACLTCLFGRTERAPEWMAEGMAEGMAEEDANLPKTALRPRHLAASLDGRVRPRLAFAEHCRAADATSSVDGSDGADGAGDAGGAGGLARSRRKLSLGAVTTMSDGAFAEALGATPEQYDQFKKSWMQRNSLTGSVKRAKSADGSEGGLDISWLPEGFDLAAQVLAMEDSSAGEGNAPDGDGEQGTLAYDGRRRR